jgi:thioesterase domain-containing protein
MAGRYAQAIRAAEPDEPVVLGGYSFGAMLAFEIARSLQAHGRPPALVVMIDTPAPGWHPGPRPSRSEQYAARVRAAGTAERLRMVANSVQWQVRAAYYEATVGLVPRNLSDQIPAFKAHHTRMMRRYEPTGTYDGDVLVLCSDEHPNGDADLGWSRIVTGPVTTARVRGHHEPLLREPWVDGVADEMNAAIRASCDA